MSVPCFVFVGSPVRVFMYSPLFSPALAPKLAGVMHRALPQAHAAAAGVRDAIGQLQQAVTKRRRR